MTLPIFHAIACLFLLMLPVQADIVYSTNGRAPDLAQRLDALLGADAPLVTMTRNPGFEAILGDATQPSRDIDRTGVYLASLPAPQGDAAFQCLSEALYFEARGEAVPGIFAVAEVILNRVDSGLFPGGTCGVVNQGTGRKYQCQFSYTCDGSSEVVRERDAWIKVAKIARLMLDGAPRDLTDGALYFHTRGVSPRWASRFHRTTTIGAHHFYARG